MRFNEVEELDGLEFSFTDTVKSAFNTAKKLVAPASDPVLPGPSSAEILAQRELPWYEQNSNLPVLGEVKRKYLIGGVGALGLLGFLYYRSTQGGGGMRRTAMAGYNRKRKRKGGKRKAKRSRRRGRR